MIPCAESDASGRSPAWEIASQPTITSEAFAGIGTQDLNDDGRAAIHDLYLRSFGDPGR